MYVSTRYLHAQKEEEDTNHLQFIMVGCGNVECDSYALLREEMAKSSRLEQMNDQLKRSLGDAVERHSRLAESHAVAFDAMKVEEAQRYRGTKDSLRNAAMSIRTMHRQLAEKQQEIDEACALLLEKEAQNKDLVDQHEQLIISLDLLSMKVETLQVENAKYRRQMSRFEVLAKGASTDVSHSPSLAPHAPRAPGSSLTELAVGDGDDPTGGGETAANPDAATSHLLHRADSSVFHWPSPHASVPFRSDAASSPLPAAAPVAPTAAETTPSSGGSGDGAVATLASIHPMMEMVSRLEKLSKSSAIQTGTNVSTPHPTLSKGESTSGRRSPQPAAVATDTDVPVLRFLCAMFPTHTPTLGAIRDVHLTAVDEASYDLLSRSEDATTVVGRMLSSDDHLLSMQRLEERSELMARHIDSLSTSPGVTTVRPWDRGSVVASPSILSHRLQALSQKNDAFRDGLVQMTVDAERMADVESANSDYWKRQAEAAAERRAELAELQKRAAVASSSNVVATSPFHHN